MMGMGRQYVASQLPARKYSPNTLAQLNQAHRRTMMGVGGRHLDTRLVVLVVNTP
jgi:hypothetical protein